MFSRYAALPLLISFVAIAFTNNGENFSYNSMCSVEMEEAHCFDSQVHTFQPDETTGNDAYITSFAPTENFGSSHELNVQYLLVGSPYHFWSLIQFTELNDPQYENATVASAQLELYKYNPIIGPFTLGVLTEDWIDSTVSWNNRPSHTGYQYVSCTVSNDWFSIDVTDQVQNWLNGSQSNYGFLLYDSDTPAYKMYQFYSCDFDSAPELRPKLVLDYIPYSSLQRTTWAEIKNSIGL